MISYAQNFEDVMAARLFPPEYRGFYIDIGAADPTFLSVTKHFYDNGWNGINVEPLMHAHSKLREARPRDINLQLIVGPESGRGSFFEVPDYPENSTTDKAVVKSLRKQGYKVRSHELEMLSLRDLCERYVGARPIDFMKIDVEGGELSVIEGADWSKFRPILLIIEAVVVNGREENWAAWEPAVLKAGYRKVHFDGLNNFYLREESLNLEEKFRLPPNLFDGFETLRPDEHARQLADNQAYHAAIINDLTAQLEISGREAAEQRTELKSALAAAEAARCELEQEHSRHVTASGDLASELRQQVEQALAESVWLRGERTADSALLREQIAQCNALSEALAQQNAQFQAMSAEHAGDLRRYLEREADLAARVAGAESSLREQRRAADEERNLAAERLAAAENERERTDQQLARANETVSSLQSKLAELGLLLDQARTETEEAHAATSSSRGETAELKRLLDQARTETEEAHATTLSSRRETAELADQLATALSQHRSDATDARELQRWFEHTLTDTIKVADAAEKALQASCAEADGLRDQIAILCRESEDMRRQAEDAAALLADDHAQVRRDYERKLDDAAASSKSQVEAIRIRDAWLTEGWALLRRLRADREEPWGMRLARELAGSRERERQAELGESVARWATTATAILAPPAISVMGENMTNLRSVANSAIRASSLDELLFLSDQAFVRSAFLSLLGREVDPEGEAYYLSRLRRGYAKIALLKQMRCSAEGRQNGSEIVGLDRAIARHRRANAPLIGWVVRQLNGEEGNGAAVRRLRAIENRIGALQHHLTGLQDVSSGR